MDIKGKRVIIVGPSSCLRKRRLGQYIDSFDVVCRVNILKQGWDPQDYGTRTDIIYTGGNPVWYKQADRTFINSHVVVQVQGHKKSKEFTGIWFEIERETADLTNVDGDINTGTLSIGHLLTLSPKEVHVYGIDFYQFLTPPPKRRTPLYYASYREIPYPDGMHSQKKQVLAVGKMISLFPFLYFDPVIHDKIISYCRVSLESS